MNYLELIALTGYQTNVQKHNAIKFQNLLIFCSVIYKEIGVPIMMIEHTIFARSNTILFDQNACLLSYNIMEEGLVRMLLDLDDRGNKFCPIICVFGRSYDW